MIESILAGALATGIIAGWLLVPDEGKCFDDTQIHEDARQALQDELDLWESSKNCKHK